MVHPAVDLRPKRVHDVFAGGRNFLKVVRFQIKMSILPRFNRIAQRFSKCNEIVKSSASFIAFSKQGRVFFIGKRWNMQSMGSAKTHLRSEKYVPVSPSFSEEIRAFVQTDSMNWN